MRVSQRSEGATLIVSLLIVMLILAVIMGITAQVTLSTRRSTADQQQLLAARYAAESGIARVQARLKVMNDMLLSSSLPRETKNSEVQAQMLALCGISGIPSSTTSSVQLCDLKDSSTGLRSSDDASNPRVALFTDAVSEQVFAAHGFSSTDKAARSRFWSEMLSGQAGMQYSGGGTDKFLAQFGLQPTRLVMDGPNTYHLYFKVPALSSQGMSGQVSQNVSARSSEPEYFFRISRDPFAKYALFSNHHYLSAQSETNGTGIYFIDSTQFNGPVHTNQHFAFDGKPWFGGDVTSAGCPAGAIGLVTTSTGEQEDGCTATATPGAYFDGTDYQFLKPDQMGSDAKPTYTSSGGRVTAPDFNGSVTWTAPFLSLPANSNDQAADALAFGLPLTGEVSDMQLYREIIGGVERQRITYTQGGVTVQLSYGPDHLMYLLNPLTNQWEVAGKDALGNIISRDVNDNLIPTANQLKFNGVISVQGGGITSLNGGPNVAQPDANGASIASFAGLTVAATGDIGITSNLKYTTPPCAGDAKTSVCNNLDARNILGVFSSGGNVNIVSPASGKATRISNDPVIQAVLMASKGAVQVEGYDQGTAMGKVNLLGGIIENYYGAFGQFSGGSLIHGFGRNFVYDQRTSDGFAPPSFPTQKIWTFKLGMKDAEGKEQVLSKYGIQLQGDMVSTGQGWKP